ncbi:uncharacterized protein LOC130695627 isoform X2 [Daphnia carinata]|uniref:uncharacterized protein LOC130695627 isoform X2 n=1 Tax=Daphnia carinata TaxID=120202 RepID=UPI00257E6374|nr:uncharacterized protein LOC130695627 isoform X2 [Daphnia carinata]
MPKFASNPYLIEWLMVVASSLLELVRSTGSCSADMHRTLLCCALLFAIISAGEGLQSLQRVCDKYNNGVDKLLLDFDEVAAAVNVSFPKENRDDQRFTSYKIYLLANWNQLEPEASCQDAHLSSHTVYDISTETDFLVSLRYVYSGFYRLTVVPWINNTISFQSINAYFIVRTTRLPMAVQNWTTQFIIHPLPVYSSIVIQFLPADPEYDFILYEVLLSDCDPSSLSISVGHTSICYANQTIPECTFENLSPGKYCAFVRPIDQRCNYGNVWQVKDHCIVHSDVIELAHSPPSGNLEWLPTGSVIRIGNHSATMLAAMVISLVIAIGFVVALIYQIRRKRSASRRNHHKFSAIHLAGATSSTISNTKKNVLLLWLRESCQLMQQVDELKDKLRKQNIKIVDIYDDELYDELSVDPLHWLNEIMSTQNLRIIVIGSPRLEQHFANENRPENELDILEGLVLYAIKQLWFMRAASHSLYSTTFFVRFSNTSYHGQTNKLTPFRCFMLPTHCEELIFYINN